MRVCSWQYFNPLPPHGGRHNSPNFGAKMYHFNPLPPHGGRLCNYVGSNLGIRISIHSLRMEGDLGQQDKCRPDQYFNPLPPHGGRLLVFLYILIHRYFNPLPPHGGRPTLYSASVIYGFISIHSLRMEGDLVLIGTLVELVISIHSLRMEGDHIRLALNVGVDHFNPLPPHGGRQHP